MKNIITKIRNQKLQSLRNICEKCGIMLDSKKLDMHHKDKNRNNNDDKNIIIVCRKCHRKIENKNIMSQMEQPVVAIPPELHARLKKVADENGQKMTWLVKKALEEYLQKIQK